MQSGILQRIQLVMWTKDNINHKDKVLKIVLNSREYQNLISRMAEDLECVAAFIGQGPPMRPFESETNQNPQHSCHYNDT